MIPTDPLYSLQGHYDLAGDLETVWNSYTGKNVRIGIYDDGVQYTHEDLAANYDRSLHFVHQGIVYDGINAGWMDRHGTASAGVVAAVAGNGVGGVGLAWDSTITSVPIIGSNALRYAPLNVTLEAYRHASNFDVMSNAWGWKANFLPAYSQLGSGWMAETVAAMAHVTAQGRGGLGTIVVQASGNDGANANGTGINASRYTITVAATDWDGQKASYSNHGANVLVSAPISQRTTDVSGRDGYNAGNYTPFGGTSAAVPFVSGITALMLEANADLGWRDVQSILAFSAQDAGSGYGNARTGEEHFAWQDNGASVWNGGGLTFSQDYGFGMVDAFTAVRMAEVWHLLHPDPATSANETRHTASMRGPDILIAANSRYDMTFSVALADSLQIENIYIDVTYRYTDTGDFILELISPQDEIIRVFDRDIAYRASGDIATATWSFGVTAFRGVEAAGDWHLRAYNNGTSFLEITDYDVHFFGDSNAADDVYHFTSGFAAMVAVDPARGVMSDRDGGEDVLDFAAIRADLYVDLSRPTGGVTGLGAPLVIENATNIENVVAGDGDDFVTGNGGRNVLHGMRGNDGLDGGGRRDYLYGGAGHDVLGGGGGADIIHGEAGNDTIHGDSVLRAELRYGVAGTAGTGAHLITDASVATNANPLAIDEDFHLEADPLVEQSDAYPSLSIAYNLGQTREAIHLSITLLQTAEIVFDVDNTYGLNGWLGIFDAGGTLIANTDGPTQRDPGSNTRYDPYLATELDAGTYVVALGQDSHIGVNPGQIAGGSFGTLNITVVGEHFQYSLGRPDWAGPDRISGGSGDDVILGGGGDDTLLGDTGNDSIRGGNDKDILFGGAGDDTLDGESNADVIYGGVGNDLLLGGGNSDILSGDDGDDVMRGDTGWDTLVGGNGNDLLAGSRGNDLLGGGLGDDTLEGGDRDDTLRGGNGQDSLLGEGGGDLLFGGNSHDFLSGGYGWDRLYGEGGWDDLHGDHGNDTLDGGEGNDRLTGGGGSDTFIFTPGYGSDTITDFEANNPNEDIDLRAIDSIENFNDLLRDHASQTPEGVMIHSEFGNTILLENVILSDLAPGDFLF